MNIDINNYEEYFLLYIDNELSQRERSAVEVFVDENEELRTAFNLLKDTVSGPDSEVKLMNKSFLFRKEAAWINEENYEEIFVLYHDGELTEEQIKETGRFLTVHTELTNEFELLGKVKMEPEGDLIFTEKKSLYRHEKSLRVIPLFVWRSIAAAVFIGVGFWFFINQNNEVVKQDKMVAKTDQKTLPENFKNDAQPASRLNPAQQEETALIEETASNKKAGSEENEVKPGRQIGLVANFQNKKEEKIAEKISTDFVEKKTEQIAVLANAKEPIERVDILPNSAMEQEIAIAANNETLNESTSNVNHALQASYIVPEPANENYLFYNIPADRFKRSKVGAFIKKVKRVVDRNDPLKLIFTSEEKQVAKN